MEGREAFFGRFNFRETGPIPETPRVAIFYAPAEECKALVTQLCIAYAMI